MSRTTVTGPDGTRWTVRSARNRVALSFLTPPRGTDDVLDVLLDGALGRLPLPAGHPASELGEARNGRHDHVVAATLVATPAVSWRLLWHLRELITGWRDSRRPSAPGRRWVVTLDARGRIRRGASWVLDPQASGDAAERVVEHVAAAVASGSRPGPSRATLLDAWDRRPNHPGVHR